MNSDELKKKQQLEKQLSKVCKETGKPFEKDVVAVVRSAVRKAWMRSPTKLSYLMMNAVHVSKVPEHLKPPKLSKLSKWLYKCEVEGTYHILNDVEVDHIVGEHSLKTYEDMATFTKSILDVSWKDLRIVSKEAHSYITYAERYSVTYEEAKEVKEVISLMKQGVAKQREFIKEHGGTPLSTAEARRLQILDIIRGK